VIGPGKLVKIATKSIACRLRLSPGIIVADCHFAYLPEMQSPSLYHKTWDRIFPNKWMLGLFLVLLFGIPRFVLVLQSYVSGQSQWVSIVFTLMLFTPLIFLRKTGRREMGLKKSTHPWWLLWVCSMFLTCMVFNRVKRESGTIAGAILTHAGFNFGMGFLIFYAL
jgi:hypothetical protein